MAEQTTKDLALRFSLLLNAAQRAVNRVARDGVLNGDPELLLLVDQIDACNAWLAAQVRPGDVPASSPSAAMPVGEFAARTFPRATRTRKEVG